MDIGNSVYLVTDHKTTGAGVPAVICGLYERSARIAIEREEGTKTFDVPLWDLLPARVYTAAILRVCYSAWDSLDHQGEKSGLVAGRGSGQGIIKRRPGPKGRASVRGPGSRGRLEGELPLSTWLKTIRAFYL